MGATLVFSQELAIEMTTLRQQENVPEREPRMLMGYAHALLVLVAATLLYFLRRSYSVPLLHGTWLAASVEQLIGQDQTEYLGVPYVGAWLSFAIVGLSLFLLMLSLDRYPSKPALWVLWFLGYSVLPTVMVTAIPWFVPISIVSPAVLFLPVAVVGAATSVVLGLLSGARPSLRRLPTVVTVIAWCALTLAILDWTNLLLIGGS